MGVSSVTGRGELVRWRIKGEIGLYEEQVLGNCKGRAGESRDSLAGVDGDKEG